MQLIRLRNAVVILVDPKKKILEYGITLVAIHGVVHDSLIATLCKALDADEQYS